MRARAVIGANFGDEGKGLLTDWLCSQGAGMVVRFNGGAHFLGIRGRRCDSPNAKTRRQHNRGRGCPFDQRPRPHDARAFRWQLPRVQILSRRAPFNDPGFAIGTDRQMRCQPVMFLG